MNKNNILWTGKKEIFIRILTFWDMQWKYSSTFLENRWLYNELNWKTWRISFSFNVDSLKMKTDNSVSSVSICVLFLPLLLFYLLFYSPFCTFFFCPRQSAIFLGLCNYRYCWALRTFSISLGVWILRFIYRFTSIYTYLNIYNIEHIDFDIIFAFLFCFSCLF